MGMVGCALSCGGGDGLSLVVSQTVPGGGDRVLFGNSNKIFK